MNTARFAHCGICVRDLEQSIQWYSDVFGFTEIKRFEKKELSIRGVLLASDGEFLEIIQPDHPIQLPKVTGPLPTQLQSVGTLHIAVAVDDMLECYKKVTEMQVEFISPLIDGRIFFCKDPDGILLEIKQKTGN